MSRTLWILILTLVSTFSFSQTENAHLNTQLAEMKTFFLTEDYVSFSNYTHPKIIDMMGGKANVVKATKEGMQKMKSEGFILTDLNFKNASDFFKKDGELQCSLTQIITMQTPKGKIVSEYTLIGISDDDGQNWTFIDTSGKNKETMLKYFPNLHRDIVIKTKKQKMID
ncbi:hypothetical protein [Hanstruepera marina]|uniref:hypothetical protein n=1 Tax=Hanstruepera marina TaxID=2873265 RepID=UPI001CA70A99|nr:hypothetical protein [Hanstruepera marina]